MKNEINPLKHPICLEEPQRLVHPDAWVQHIPFAMYLVNILKPRMIVELGTHSGNSYCAFCQAVDSLGLKTTCFAVDTWQGDPQAGLYGQEVLEELRDYHDPRYGDFSKLMQTTFDEAVGKFINGSIDLLHIDGLHTYEAVRHDFETWLPKMSRRGVVVLHDINEKRNDFGVWKVWEELREKYPGFDFSHGHGLGVLGTGKKQAPIVEDMFQMGGNEQVAFKKMFSDLGRRFEQELAITRNEELLGEAQRQLSQKEELLGEAQRQLSQKEELLGEAQRQLSQKEELLGKTQQQLSQIKQELNLIKASKSWKLALSLRRARKVVLPPNSLQARLIWRIHSRIKKFSRAKKNNEDIALIMSSELFDPEWYLNKYPDVAEAKMDPARHYLLYGGFENRDPSDKFCTGFYLEQNPDVKNSQVNPLLHYELYGRNEKRQIKSDLFRIGHPENSYKPYTEFKPLVSIIVPNYNHKRFLDKRLESIYKQTYKNFEVILLDDCSNDGSQEILNKFFSKYRLNTRLYLNKNNSGSVFSQWAKGISLARGDLIWIAESDDFCDWDFLEKMVPNFKDEAIMLSYANSIFVDEKGKKHPFAYDYYLSDIKKDKWKSSYVSTAHQEVNDALGIKNTIPNVSAVIFRKPSKGFPLIENENWKRMRICGDWLLYLNILRGGKIAFCHETNNYFRLHKNSSSKKTHSKDVYYREHEIVACSIASQYKITDCVLNKNYRLIEKFFRENVNNDNVKKFRYLYNLDNVEKCEKERVPNILMVVFGFIVGGGEIVPINLANELWNKNCSVTVLNFGYGEQIDGVRKMLNPQIPVINYRHGMSLKKIIDEYGIECIHTHHASMEYFVADRSVKEGFNTYHVATMHGMYEMMKNQEKSIKFIDSKVNHWFYIAQKNILPFRDIGLFNPKKFTKINNGMAPREINSIEREKYGIPKNAFLLCLASRGLKEKGWYEAIEAVKISRRQTGRDIHLFLLGNGPVYDELKFTELPKFIHLLGFVDNVVDYLSISDISILPSYYSGESVPLVIIQSLQAETPIIASNIGEVKNMIIEEGIGQAGILIDLNNQKIDIEQLAHAILKMATDEIFYKNCVINAKKLKEKFSIDSVIDIHKKIYKNAITE